LTREAQPVQDHRYSACESHASVTELQCAGRNIITGDPGQKLARLWARECNPVPVGGSVCMSDAIRKRRCPEPAVRVLHCPRTEQHEMFIPETSDGQITIKAALFREHRRECDAPGI